MKIVIDIDEGIAQGIIDGEKDVPMNIVRAFQATIADAIKNGTPLPKGHGRLIDADDVKENHRKLIGYLDADMIERLNIAIDKHVTTIIEGETE